MYNFVTLILPIFHQDQVTSHIIFLLDDVADHTLVSFHDLDYTEISCT